MDKLVFISNMASPYQIKLCYALNKYFDTEFWFHVQIEKNRPDWWSIPLGDKCKILEKVILKRVKKYLSLKIYKQLCAFNPDIILLGGFSHLSNYLAYRWGKRKGKKVVIFRESYRIKNKNGDIKLVTKGAFSKVIRFLYRKIDGVIASNEEAFNQLKNEFKFNNVFLGHYAADIDDHLTHSFRTKTETTNILFGNRLMPMYNPLEAIETIRLVSQKHKVKLSLNPQGLLKDKCNELIKKYKLEGTVEFLKEPDSWASLHRLYQQADILFLPATFSNGNLTIYDAMASGCGIVISNNILGTSGSLVVNNKNGFVCETTDSYVEAICTYIETPDLYLKHGILNRELIKKFSADETAKLFSNILNSI